MQIIVRRGADVNSLTVIKDGQKNTFDINTLDVKGQGKGLKRRTPILPEALRQMVVDSWAEAHGFAPVYSEPQKQAA